MAGIKDIGKVYDDFFGPRGDKPKKTEEKTGENPDLELGLEKPQGNPQGTISSLADEVRRIREMVEGDISAIDEAVRKTLESNGKGLNALPQGNPSDASLESFKESLEELTQESQKETGKPSGQPQAVPSQKEQQAKDGQKQEKPEKPAMEELDELIGLTTIKRDVKELVDLVRTQTLREKEGLKTVPVSLHLVFSGNPGTGKTTVARILARLYKEIGALKTGQLVECDRSSLVAGFVGQTAIKTQEKIQEAMGGVLFIDEAYTLAKEGQDYGQEAIDTLLKAMEDHRGEFVVIVAGYTQLMERFINSNPGLRSRFTKYIEFPDYSCQELCDIFDLQCKKYQYVLDEEARRLVTERITQMEAAKGENFANARDVRTLFEKLITVHATRIAHQENPTQEELKTIRGEDVAGLYQGENPEGVEQAEISAPLELDREEKAPLEGALENPSEEESPGNEALEGEASENEASEEDAPEKECQEEEL